MRMPISKQRNMHIQHVLVEAAKLAPRYSHELALLREKEIQESGHPGGSQEAGGLHARGGPQETGLRVQTLLISKNKNKIIRCAGYQVLQ